MTRKDHHRLHTSLEIPACVLPKRDLGFQGMVLNLIPVNYPEAIKPIVSQGNIQILPIARYGDSIRRTANPDRVFNLCGLRVDHQNIRPGTGEEPRPCPVPDDIVGTSLR